MSSPVTRITRRPPTGAPVRPDPAAAPPRVNEPLIRVVGVGGGGVNAVDRSGRAGVTGVEFMAVNADLQSLRRSAADLTVHIGGGVTRGLDTAPTRGARLPRRLHREQDRIKRMLKGSTSSSSRPAAAPEPVPLP